MTVKIAINGFGRIGRLVLRSIMESGRKDVTVVGINDLASAEANAHLFKYDSVHGRFAGDVKVQDGKLVINGHAITMTQVKDPAQLPWKDLGVDIAMECTGIFTKKEDAMKHVTAGARKVLISAPATDEDITVVYGVNHDKLAANHVVVSNASCTTNCLAPVVHVLHKAIGIKHGFMTTIHSYTGDQNTVDTMHKDLHRARAAAVNIIPTSTGARKLIRRLLTLLPAR
jgi:glyceraldehyde 3-phosphate dehydrogenase